MLARKQDADGKGKQPPDEVKLLKQTIMSQDDEIKLLKDMVKSTALQLAVKDQDIKRIRKR